MGLPQINIIFEGLANTIKFRSERGIVAIVINDDVATNNSYVFKRFEDIKDGTFSEQNLDYLNLVFLGNPNKVLVEVINSENSRTLDTVLKDLELKKFNWFTMPQIQTDEVSKVTTWIKAKRKSGKTYKAILANTAANDEGIVNFTTTGIKVGEKSYTTTEYCARLAGVFAGLSLTRSATYFVLEDVTEITQHDDPNGDIDSGKLILINDGSKIKIGRGVNSLTTVSKPKTEDMKKVKIIEAMDMVRDDIHTTFEDHYVGQVPNNYDNKIIFLSSINLYFSRLQKEEIMDRSYDCYAQIDINKHIEILSDRGIDIDTLSEQQIKETNTGSNVYATGKVQFVDAMEDLDLKLFM